MKADEYEMILEEAHARFSQYLELEETATHLFGPVRKEDFLMYWVAVVAKEAKHD